MGREGEDLASQKWLLFLIAWKGKKLDPSYFRKNILKRILDEKLVEADGKGFKATEAGRALLSPGARAALNRPVDFDELEPSVQWAIDKRLGILDWDGS